jgi:hypothetical protein
MPSGLLRILRIFAAKNTVGQTKNSSVSTSSLGVLGALAVRKSSLQSSILNPQSLPLPLAFLAPWRLENLLFNPQSSILNPQSLNPQSLPLHP